jgi:SAM-dependent methyltransferase
MSAASTMEASGSVPESVFVRLDGRLAQFKRAHGREYWEAEWARLSDAGLAHALRPSTRLGSHGPFFRRHLPQGAWVLEAGCGVGLWLRRFTDRGYRAVGLDYAVQSLSRSKRACPDLAFLGGDLRGLPFGDESFDAHVSFGVLEHYERGPDALLAEAHRILKPDGVLLASVPRVNRFRREVEVVSEDRARSGGYVFHQYYFREVDMEQMLREAGFAMLPGIHYCSAHHGLLDGTQWYAGFESKLGPLRRATQLLDFVPGLAAQVGHMMFVAARKA